MNVETPVQETPVKPSTRAAKGTRAEAALHSARTVTFTNSPTR